jgi:hypothetical protein
LSDRFGHRRWLVGLLALAVLALVMIVLLQSGGGGSSPPPVGSTAQPPPQSGPRPQSIPLPPSSEALINSIGVVVHFNYADTAYGNQPGILLLLKALGVRHIRDAVAAPGSPLAAGLRAAAREGITADLATASMSTPPAQSVADSLQVVGSSVYAFEGPNEVDSSGVPGWPQAVGGYMPALAAAVRRMAPGAALIQPSVLNPASRRLLPALGGLYNEHPYPLGGPPEPALRKALAELPANALERGVVFTETGYHDALHSTVGQPPVSEQAAAVYLPRLLVSDFAAGVRATFIYELADEKPDPGQFDPEQHFGLVRYNLSPKAAFLALRTLIGALRTSPGPAGRRSIHAILEAHNDVSRLYLVRPDGSQVLALWRPVSVWDPNARRALDPGREQTEIKFDAPAKAITVWRPSASTAPVEQVAQSRALRIELGGDLVLVSFR